MGAGSPRSEGREKKDARTEGGKDEGAERKSDM